MLEALVQGLSAEPRVASNVCWAFSSLADAAYEAAESDSEETPQTYCLSAFFDPIVQKLLETTGTLGSCYTFTSKGAFYQTLKG